MSGRRGSPCRLRRRPLGSPRCFSRGISPSGSRRSGSRPTRGSAFSDTDAQGVVYYGRYLPYFDLARTEYHRSLGPVDGAARSEFVMRASNVEYHAPARFDDLLEVFVRVPRIGRTSVTYEYAAYRLDSGDEETLMVTATQTVVLIDHDDRCTLPVPDAFRAARVRVRGHGAVSDALEAVGRSSRPAASPTTSSASVVGDARRLRRRLLGRDPLRRERRARARPGGGDAGGDRPDPGAGRLRRARHVADLAAEGCDDPALLERVAALIPEHCLVGWDTGGVPWEATG